MSDRRGWGSTVLGWFVVQEEPSSPEAASDGPAVPTPDPVPDAPKPADAAQAAVLAGQPPPAAPGGRVDFDAVFEAAGVEAVERERVRKALGLIDSLPAETPIAVKKQIVGASLEAFGVSIEGIIEAGAAEIEALEGYIRAGAADTTRLIEEAEVRIRQFEEEIQRLRSVRESRVQEQQGVVNACNARKLEVQRVLEFFGQDVVASVVRSSPRLHDPSADPSSSQ